MPFNRINKSFYSKFSFFKCKGPGGAFSVPEVFVLR